MPRADVMKWVRNGRGSVIGVVGEGLVDAWMNENGKMKIRLGVKKK